MRLKRSTGYEYDIHLNNSSKYFGAEAIGIISSDVEVTKIIVRE